MRLLAKLVLVSLLIAVPVFSQPVDDETRLRQIAHAVILEENRLATSSDHAPVLRPLHAAFADEVWQRMPEIETERAERALRGLRYTSSTTEFRDEQLQIDGDAATVSFIEATRIALDVEGATGAPDATEYEKPHVFTFRRTTDDWQLIEHKPGADFPFADAGDDQQATETGSASDNSQVLMERAPVQTQAYAISTLSRSAIVNYALKYWGSGMYDNRGYNTAYRTFTNDCTNFISQGVANGGWTAVTGWYQSDDAWWYTFYPFPLAPGQSYTWAGAQNWSNFVARRGRGYLVSTMSELSPGDVLQIDFQNDSHIDHSMIVTAKDSKGTIYLTYHTVNYKNREFFEMDRVIKKTSPNVKYWRWKLNDKFY